VAGSYSRGPTGSVRVDFESQSDDVVVSADLPADFVVDDDDVRLVELHPPVNVSTTHTAALTSCISCLCPSLHSDS